MFGFFTKKAAHDHRYLSVPLAMECLTCSECGCTFMLSLTHLTCLRESCSVFYCPNGHMLSYNVESNEQRSEPLKVQLSEANEKITKLKRENIKLIHDREQMETKLSENKSKE